MEESDRGNVQNGHVAQSRLSLLLLQSYHRQCWVPHHNIELCSPLMIDSTQGILSKYY